MVYLSDYNDSQVPRLIHGSMELPDSLGREHPESFHHAARLVAKANILGIQQPPGSEIHELVAGMLQRLHLRVHDTGVISFAVDMVHLGQACLVRQVGQDDMLEVDGQDLRKAFPPGRIERVGRVVGGGPGVGPGVSSGGQLIQQSLVLVAPGAHEHEMFERVRGARVVEYLSGEGEIAIDLGTLPIGNDDLHATRFRLVARDGGRGIFEGEALDLAEARLPFLVRHLPRPVSLAEICGGLDTGILLSDGSWA